MKFEHQKHNWKIILGSISDILNIWSLKIQDTNPQIIDEIFQYLNPAVYFSDTRVFKAKEDFSETLTEDIPEILSDDDDLESKDHNGRRKYGVELSETDDHIGKVQEKDAQDFSDSEMNLPPDHMYKEYKDNNAVSSVDKYFIICFQSFHGFNFVILPKILLYYKTHNFHLPFILLWISLVCEFLGLGHFPKISGMQKLERFISLKKNTLNLRAPK